MTPSIDDPRHVCLPCMNGEHAQCRHRPDGPRFGRAPEGARCECEKAKHRLGSGTCSDCRTGDHHYRRCGKPAKGTVVVPGRFTYGLANRDVEVERCGVHLAGLRRQAENDAKRRAERDEWRAQWEAEKANGRAAEDWAARLLSEFGIVADAHADPAGPRVIVNPERLYGLIREAVTEMDAAGIEHGFHGPGL